MKEITEAQQLVEEIEADLAPPGGLDIAGPDAAPPADQGDEAISLLRDIRDLLADINGDGDDEEDEDDLDDLDDEDDDLAPEDEGDFPAPEGDEDDEPVAPLA